MRCQRGFSLLEVIIATTLVASALIGLAQLIALAVDANRHAKDATLATLLARQKMEELYALNENVDGGCDFVDASGRRLGETPIMPASAGYVRRWSIEPLPAYSGNVVAVQVLVTPHLDHHLQPGTVRRRMPGEAHLVSIRRR